MNPLEKLIWNHDKLGDAKSFLLTREELAEIVEAAQAVGYDLGYEEGSYDPDGDPFWESEE